MKETFPDWFLAFLEENKIDLKEYDQARNVPRFIRFKPSKNEEEEEDLNARKALLEAQLKVNLTQVEWLPDFYSLPASVPLSSCPMFRQGLVYGMDVSSGLAVHALELKGNDQVLDLCCAPGGKLCYAADIMGPNDLGTVTGVDISGQRLATCRSIARKYKFDRIRLFEADGTTFDVHAPSRIGPHIRGHEEMKEMLAVMSTKASETQENQDPPTKRRKYRPPVKPFHASKMLRSDPQIQHESLLYDKVLVDAECTHDGSITHLKEAGWKSWDEVKAKFLDNERLKNLEKLQRHLLENGFRMLKGNGILVYSTCSFDKKQNEDIIQWFLAKHPDARLESIPNAHLLPERAKSHLPNLEPVIRLSPSISNTGGFFLARIRKVKSPLP